MTQQEAGEIVTEWVEISSSEVVIKGYVARPAETGRSHVLVVIPENPGIMDWRQQETQRMARDLGWPVVVMSPYSRLDSVLPPQGPFSSADERRRAAFLAMPDEQVALDLEAVVAWVRTQRWAYDERPPVLGFCSGGGQAVYAAASRPQLAACVVSIYGNIVLRGEFTPDCQPIERFDSAAGLEVPLQLHVGSEDFEIPAAHVDRFESELQRHGKQGEVFRYDGANHIFADATHPNYAPAATAEMWSRVYGFLLQWAESS